jgi:hypothetical protein
MEVIQIVPRLPPAIDGVGDYAFLLAKQLRTAHGIQTRFIVCDPNWKPEVRPPISGLRSPVLLDGFPVYQLKERTAKELLRVLNQPTMPPTVLLQYVGYGYQTKGCPIWLPRSLRAWRNQSSVIRGSVVTSRASDFQSPTSPRLVTMFHELYASGPPWRLVFYHGLIQRWIVRKIHQMSSFSLTSTVWTERLLNQVGRGMVFRQPVPSNIPASVIARRLRSSGGPWNVLIFGH